MTHIWSGTSLSGMSWIKMTHIWSGTSFSGMSWIKITHMVRYIVWWYVMD